MKRYRRLRQSAALRDLVRETHLTKDDVIQPFFVIEGRNKKQAIAAMPGIYRYTVDGLLKQIEKYINAGGKAGLLFGIPKVKNKLATQAYTENGVVQKAVKSIKKQFPDFIVITDVCLCAYMDHGHCGVVENRKIDNDKTLPLLSKMAISHAQAGVDIVAPSDMMDFRVGSIRKELDKKGFENVLILSYAVKYASEYYGPFREAAGSSPTTGDRKTYQMDGANSREALKEAWADIEEGTDMIMVKPALSYLDIISSLKFHTNVPIVAYNVSGEYSMIKAASQKGWVDEQKIVLETLTSMKRAGADIIITYYAQDVLKWISKNQ